VKRKDNFNADMDISLHTVDYYHQRRTFIDLHRGHKNKNRATLFFFLIISPAFLGRFYTFYTSGNRNEYSTDKLTKFITSP